jgi:hypothetical protein
MATSQKHPLKDLSFSKVYQTLKYKKGYIGIDKGNFFSDVMMKTFLINKMIDLERGSLGFEMGRMSGGWVINCLTIFCSIGEDNTCRC